jgi:hypothetical protein
MWLAGRIRSVDGPFVSAEEMSRAAAAEAETGAGEPLVGCTVPADG